MHIFVLHQSDDLLLVVLVIGQGAYICASRVMTYYLVVAGEHRSGCIYLCCIKVMTYYLVVAGEHRSGCIYLCCIKVMTHYLVVAGNIGQGAYICAASK